MTFESALATSYLVKDVDINCNLKKTIEKGSEQEKERVTKQLFDAKCVCVCMSLVCIFKQAKETSENFDNEKKREIKKKCFKLINRFLFNNDDDDNVIRRLIKTFFNCYPLLTYESSQFFLAGVCYIQSS